MAAPGILIYDWLERIGLNHAVPKFKERGIDTPAAPHCTSFTFPNAPAPSVLLPAARSANLIWRKRRRRKQIQFRAPVSSEQTVQGKQFKANS